jgi:dephospho-CoA kinase
MSGGSQRFVIGVTGLNASGKSTVCQYFSAAPRAFEAVSLSDAIRAELTSQKKEHTRDNLVACGNELRHA